MITLKSINRNEAMRYMAYKDGISLDKSFESYLDECEKRVLDALSPKYLFRYFDLSGCPIPLEGNDISAHLEGCYGVVLMCATAGAGVDRLNRILQIEDMAKAVIADAFSGAAVEEICNMAEEEIKAALAGKYLTWRYSPGYGDFPLTVQNKLLEALDAPRRIGLCVSESLMLTPIKSVTAVMGVSDSPLPQRLRGCVTCNMRKSCQYRKRGLHCGF